MKRLQIRVIGRVQQVGFRAWTQKTAQELGLHGSVQNLKDGSVLVIAQGAEQVLQEFCELLKGGPMGARVVDLESAELDLDDNCLDFKIGPTIDKE